MPPNESDFDAHVPGDARKAIVYTSSAALTVTFIRTGGLHRSSMSHALPRRLSCWASSQCDVRRRSNSAPGPTSESASTRPV
jgi:hypothetical protein